ncbi:hypothetical protein HaLaN_07153 [Haematococcus lacustris]|uniref:Uncharacterized protein n=1 Tax=Haematococcus lacustris TaxID=44745 RepID=A0A699YND1_HAELA|nr:hypothetical protein HaLaN_07153 [Haematococcus lacustris]
MRAVTFAISLLCMLARCPAAPDAAPTPQRLVAKLETEAALASKGLSTGATAQLAGSAPAGQLQAASEHSIPH